MAATCLNYNKLRGQAVGGRTAARKSKRVKRSRAPRRPVETGVSDSLPSTRKTARRTTQLPSFAPLLEEIELAGWTAECGPVAGGFYDWLPLDAGRWLVASGQAGASGGADPIEVALVAQSVWTALRAQSLHTSDAETLISLVMRTLSAWHAERLSASLAVATVEPLGGRICLAATGDCLALRIRASCCESLPLRQGVWGMPCDRVPLSCSIELRPRERLALLTGMPASALDACTAAVSRVFAGLPAESHRSMTGSQTVAQLRKACAVIDDTTCLTPCSMAVVKRR